MRIAIYGAGKYGLYVYNEIMSNKSTNMSVTCWIDNYFEENLLESLSVYTEDIFFGSNKLNETDAVLVAIQNRQSAEDIIVSMLLRGYESIYWALPAGYLPQLPVLNEDGSFGACVRFFRQVKPTMGGRKIVNFLVTDYCNLKCKRCGNFSNLEKECNYLDLNSFEQYLQQLRKKFRGVSKIQLMGGEPLLNLRLETYIFLTRKYFPETNIDIVTNGLLILEMGQALIDAIISCHVCLRISQYPPTRKRLEKIVDFLEDKEIDYRITRPITQFERALTLKETDGKKAYAERSKKNCQCHTIENGRMGCPLLLKFYDNRSYFGIEIEEEEMQESSIDLMDDSIDGWAILKFFEQPSTLCKYCNPAIENEAWEVGLPQKEEWFSS